jgi:segregation and condensation protein B
MEDAFEHAVRLVEAFIFASAEPVSAGAVAKLVPEPHSADEVLTALQARCRGRGVHLVEVAGGWQFRTALDFADELSALMQKPRRLPRAAMEMLAIIAQYQPVTRAEIEEIRGASLSQATVDLLLEAGLIEPKGVKEASGRPTLWATTPAFLAHFGLRSLRDLPGGGVLMVEAGPPGPASGGASEREQHDGPSPPSSAEEGGRAPF